MAGSENGWGVGATGGRQLKRVRGSENVWGAAKTGGVKLKRVVSGTYSF